MISDTFMPGFSFFFFFFHDTAATEIYTLSLHDALPICPLAPLSARLRPGRGYGRRRRRWSLGRSEKHTSELQSHHDLVCRLLLDKKKKPQTNNLKSKTKKKTISKKKKHKKI